MQLNDYYQVVGEGAPFVLIHGSFASTSTWKPMLPSLSKKYKCILFKLPGHCGLADPLDFDNPTLATEVNLLRDIIAKEADQPVKMAGHSFGGVVALDYALRFGENLRALTLFEPVSTWVLDLAGHHQELEVVHAFLGSYRADAKAGDTRAGARVIDFWCASDAFSQLPKPVQESLLTLQANNLRHWDLCTAVNHSLADLASMAVPTQLVVGEKSVSVAHGIIDTLYHQLPVATKLVVPKANHLLVTSHSDACLAAM